MKPALVLVGGWAFAEDALEPLAAGLQSRFTTQTVAADLFRPELRPASGPTWLLGWSLGGMLAMECALHHPDLVQGLILINTTARFTRSTDWLHGLPASEVRALARALRRDVATGLRGFMHLSAQRLHNRAETDQPLKNRLRDALQPLLEGLNYLERTDLRTRVPALRMPVYVLHAREDAVIPFGAGSALAESIPGARLIPFEGSGHDLPVRDPARVAAALQECRP